MAEKNKTVTFIAKCSNLNVLLGLPQRARRNSEGLRIDSPFYEAQFEQNTLTVDADELVDPDAKEGSPTYGLTVVEALQASPSFNVPGNDGFWEVGNAPDEPKPTTKAQLAAIRKAARKGDADALQAVKDEELATHSRDIVLDAVNEELAAIAEGDSEESEDSKEKPSSRRTSTRSARV